MVKDMDAAENRADRGEIIGSLKEKPRVILGLDVSTACIGATILVDDGSEKPKIAKITHFSPKAPKKMDKVEALFVKKRQFEEEFLKGLADYYITDVVIEEPLLSSNNVNTVATLLRFNGMISDAVYCELGLVPHYISSYDARMYSFPDLMALRKYNKKGAVYPEKTILKAAKNDHLVLFGAYPFDVDKKLVMMNKVDEMYGDIEWLYGKDNELRKENFDACDSLVCALAYVNVNRNGLERPTMAGCPVVVEDTAGGGRRIRYCITIWGDTYDKEIDL